MTESPRWKLLNAHYLNLVDLNGAPATEWEYTEADRSSGRKARKLFMVPAFIDPREPADCNRDGECIVTQMTEGARLIKTDHIFVGDPTPDMEPLNDEAMAISQKFAEKWKHPIESLDGSFSQSILAGFEKQIAVAIANNGGAIPLSAMPNASFDQDEFNAMKAQLGELQAQLAAVLKNPPPATPALESAAVRR